MSFEVYIIDRHTKERCIAIAELARRKDLIGLRKNGWKFNFLSLFSQGFCVYKVVYNDVLQGLIAFYDDRDMQAVKIVNVEVAPHNRGNKSEYYIVGSTLFAIAAKYSFECGQEGYLFLEAKTRLIAYYRNTLGARLIMPPLGMGIFPNQSNILISKYVVG